MKQSQSLKEIMTIIDQVQKQLEQSKTFKYEQNESGLSFDDFAIVYKETNEVIKNSNKETFEFVVMLKNDNTIDSVIYSIE